MIKYSNIFQKRNKNEYIIIGVIFLFTILVQFPLSKVESSTSIQIQTTSNKEFSENDQDSAQYLYEPLSASDIEGMKKVYGIWEENTDYNKIVYGHLTGLAPPKLEDYDNLLKELAADYEKRKSIVVTPQELAAKRDIRVSVAKQLLNDLEEKKELLKKSFSNKRVTVYVKA